MSTMERILRLMAEKKASDVYLSANAPALIKINGECVPINNQILPPDATRNLLSEIVPPDRIEELEETGELNMGVPLSGVGRFRVSAMRQRGSYAVVIRFIAQEVPNLQDLNLPPALGDLIMDLSQRLARGEEIPRVSHPVERVFSEFDEDVLRIPPRGY